MGSSNVFYELNLLKRNGSYMTTDASVSMPGHMVLGYFDRMIVQQGSIKNAIDSMNARRGEDDSFLSYRIYIFDLNEPSLAPSKIDLAALLLENGCNARHHRKEGQIFLLSALQIHELYYQKEAKERGKRKNENLERRRGIDMLQDVEKEIRTSLSGVLSKKGDKVVEYAIYGAMGSFDLMLFSASDDIAQLGMVLYTISSLRNKALIDYSSSFLVIPNYAQIEDLPSTKIKALFQCAMYQINADPKQIGDSITSKLQGNGTAQKEEVEPVIPLLVTGDDDIIFHVSAPFNNLCRLLKLGLLSDKVTTWPSLVRSVHVIGNISDSFDFNGDQDKRKEVRSLLEGHKKQAGLFKQEMWESLDRVRPYLPQSTLYNLESLIRMAGHLLDSDYHFFIGKKVQRILVEAIRQMMRNKTLMRKSACSFVDDLSFYFFNCMKLDSILLNKVNEVDDVSPISKIMLSYENIIYSVTELVNNDKGVDVRNNWKLFVTISHTEMISSKLYFWAAEGNTESKLLSFNLPAAYLSLGKVLPFLLHEISHHIIFSQDRTVRNEALRAFVTAYFSVYVTERLEERGTTVQQPESYIAGMMSKIVKMGAGRIGDVGKKRFSQYVYELSDAMRSVVKTLNALLWDESEQGGKPGLAWLKEFPVKGDDKLLQVKTILQQVLMETDRLLVREKIEDIANAFREARADVIELTLGGYDIKTFIDQQYSILDREKLLSGVNRDEMYLLRMAAVISYVIQRDMHRKDSNTPARSGEDEVRARIEAYLNDECRAKFDKGEIGHAKYELSRLFCVYAQDCLYIVQPVVRYLRSILSDKEIKLTQENFGIEPSSFDDMQEVLSHLDNWYKYMMRLVNDDAEAAGPRKEQM